MTLSLMAVKGKDDFVVDGSEVKMTLSLMAVKKVKMGSEK